MIAIQATRSFYNASKKSKRTTLSRQPSMPSNNTSNTETSISKEAANNIQKISLRKFTSSKDQVNSVL